MHRLRDGLRDRPFGFLFENVVMTAPDAKVISDELGGEPIFACAGDFGWGTRQRLWWMSVDWNRHSTDPATGTALAWGEHQCFRRLRLEGERRAASSFKLGGLSFPEGVASGRLRFPCATTPAADENGRPAPRGSRGKTPPDAHARWMADNRQFAPWHYKAEQMMSDSGGRLVIPPPSVKEQLHDIPIDFTKVSSVTDRDRHRLLGNGWHWGVARRLLSLLVFATVAATFSGGSAHSPAGSPEPRPESGGPLWRGPAADGARGVRLAGPAT